MKKLVVYMLLMFLPVLLFSACGSGSDEGSDGDQTDGDFDLEMEQTENNENAVIEINNFYVTENTANSLSFYAEWETDLASVTELEVVCDKGYEESFANENHSTSHKVFVMGLVPDSQCDFTAIATDENGLKRTASKSVSVSLTDFFPQMNLIHSDNGKMQKGWTLFNLVNTGENKPLSIAIIDELGRYRWYYRVPTTATGADNDVRTVNGGILIGGTNGVILPQKVDWEGNLIWKAQLDMHHDIRPYKNDKNYLYLSYVNTCDSPTFDNADNLSDSVHIFDLEKKQTVWSWALCHHYTPEKVVNDWSHFNTVVPFPNENAILISSREQHALFKVDMDTEEVVWKLGLDGDFQMKEEDLFFRQHSPEIEDNGNILLFDNGDDREPNVRKYSRALEIAYNEDKMTAEVVWQYRHDPDIFSPVWSDADRLANGNVLVTFGKEYGVTAFVEVTHEDTPEVVWEVSPKEGWGAYRSERIPNPVKGYVIEIDN